ncbi:DgyrCDS6068 [Dimorphilus gyrociliatus]|uniref:Ribosome production factor 2 homolog n=1 Tax=Dimorphilus gyrociliatus TaxID=2664684 RepID=A0A7I8VMP3_9ANNE|nr:DgyrCDS6068 [Dimorphilus gyrociliatus]
MALQRVVKPKTQRSKRALENRAPKIHENDKNAMIIKGGQTSQVIIDVLKDIYALKKMNSVLYKKKNITRPFEDTSSVEFFSQRSDSSLLLFGSHSKKRPHNLVFGRFFDYHILDMAEFGVEKFKGMSEFKKEKCCLGTKPCLVFNGLEFSEDPQLLRIKNLFIDFFRGPVVKNITLQGLEHVLSFSYVNEKILLRSYKIMLKKSGQKTPRIELDEIGPSLDLSIRRTKLASDDLFKKACKVPKAAKERKVKNKSQDVFGNVHGQIHMTPQDMSKLQIRKRKALKNDEESPKRSKKSIV